MNARRAIKITAEARDRAQREREAWLLWHQGGETIYGEAGGWAGNDARNRWLKALPALPAWGRALKWHADSRHPHDKSLRGCVLARVEDAGGRLTGVLRLFNPDLCAARRLMPVMAFGTIKGAAVRLIPDGPDGLVVADGVFAALEIEAALPPAWALWAAPGAALGCPPAGVAVPEGAFPQVAVSFSLPVTSDGEPTHAVGRDGKGK
jgi:hypothetical protein